MEIINSEIKIAGYENIYVDCPYCKKENIFNRVSDLKTNRCIVSLNVICQFCKKEFHISNDKLMFPEFLSFLDELEVLKKQKNYRLYILTLCQGIECFLEQAIINKILDRNSNLRDEDGKIDIKKYNKELKELYDKKTMYDLCQKGFKKEFKKAAFNDLREMFLFLFDDERKNDNGNLKKLKEDKREKSFKEIKDTNINEMRNKVIHKQAYRPSLEEIEKFNNLIDAIYWLQSYLKVEDSKYLLNQGVEAPD